MSENERELLDECTNGPTCTAVLHVATCTSSPQLRLLGALQRSVDAARAERRAAREPEYQKWQRTVYPADVGEGLVEHAVIDVDDRGIVHIEESALAQLLVDAGWERTA